MTESLELLMQTRDEVSQNLKNPNGLALENRRELNETYLGVVEEIDRALGQTALFPASLILESPDTLF